METAEPANSSNSFRPCKMSDDAAASEDSIKVSMGLADPAPSRSRAGNRFRCPYAPPLRTRIGMVPLSSVFAGFRAEQFARWATTVPVHPRFPGSAPISLCRRVHRTKPGAGCGTRRRGMLLRWREKSGYSTTAIPPPPPPYDSDHSFRVHPYPYFAGLHPAPASGRRVRRARRGGPLPRCDLEHDHHGPVQEGGPVRGSLKSNLCPSQSIRGPILRPCCLQQD